METKFQTSFIPKKTIAPLPGTRVPSHRAPTSLFMILAVVMFLASIGGIGGVYAWKQILLTTQENYKKELAEREKQFNIDLIEHLKQVNIKIDLSKNLLSKHLALSTVFDVISRLTTEQVRFLDMKLMVPANPAEGIDISMRGYGANLSVVAFQSDVLNQLERYGLRKIVKNPILANPDIDSGGTVGFDMRASLDPSTLTYEKVLGGELDDFQPETAQ